MSQERTVQHLQTISTPGMSVSCKRDCQYSAQRNSHLNFAVGLVDAVLQPPEGQVKFLGKSFKEIQITEVL